MRLGPCLLALLALPAFAANVRLVYERATPEHACPDESALRQLVAARLGKDPFSPVAASVVTVKLSGAGPFQSDVTLETPDSPPRRKTLNGAACLELLQSTAVAVALAVDPLLQKPEPQEFVLPPLPPPPPAPIRGPARPEPQPTPPAPSNASKLKDAEPEPELQPLTWSVSAAITANAGTSNIPQPTPRAEVRTGRNAWSVGLEAQLSVPLTFRLSTGGWLSITVFRVGLVPCLTWKWFSGCVDVTLGAMGLEGGGLTASRGATVFFSSTELRAMLLIPFTSRFSAGAMGEVGFALSRPSAVVAGQTVWATSSVLGAGGLVFRFGL